MPLGVAIPDAVSSPDPPPRAVLPAAAVAPQVALVDNGLSPERSLSPDVLPGKLPFDRNMGPNDEEAEGRPPYLHVRAIPIVPSMPVLFVRLLMPVAGVFSPCSREGSEAPAVTC